MSGYPLPDATLASHLAVIGKTGAGKTTTSKLAVEHLAEESERVCVLDPIKSDWWGLTSSADGKRPGLPFVILGGPHGHMPLHAGAGRALAEIVANGELPLSILDMRNFPPGGHARFFCDFAEALLGRQRGVVHLVMEEAHLFAPKERSGIGPENLSIHWAKMLATAGRSAGIRLIVATQRSQSLHNAVLGSCETLIAHRLTTPADQKPVVDWLKGNTPKEVAAEVAASLAGLPTGTGWVCSGELKLFEKIAFPRIATYDNSATPTGDMGIARVRTAPVDLDRLKSVIGEAAKEAEANDPKALKARVAELEARLAKKPAAAAAPDLAAVERAVSDAYDVGATRGLEAGFNSGYGSGFGAAIAEAQGALSPLFMSETRRPSQISIDANVSLLIATWNATAKGAPELAPAPQTPAVPVEDATADDAEANGVRVGRPISGAPQASDMMSAADEDLADGRPLGGPHRQLLGALSWWRAMGHETVSRPQLAAIAGWKVKSSHLRATLAELVARVLVEYPSPGEVRLTAAGIAAAPQPDLHRKLLVSLRQILTGAQRTLFDLLVASDGEPIMRHDLASAAGWAPTSSHLRATLAALKTLEVIDYPRPHLVALQAWVREAERAPS